MEIKKYSWAGDFQFRQNSFLIRVVNRKQAC